MIKFFGYKKCSTCRDAEAYLTKKKVNYTFIDITEDPPSKEELKKIYKISGEPIKKFFNTSGLVYRELGLKDKVAQMSDDEALSLLVSNGRLIKRPLVFDGKSVTIGFNEKTYKEVWV